MSQTDYTYISANSGLNGGQRHSYRVELLQTKYKDKLDDENWSPFKNYLALVRIGRRSMSWDTVEECHRMLVPVEKEWGVLVGAQVAMLNARQHVVYVAMKNLCMPLRENVYAFTDKPEAKRTLEIYLKDKALKQNFCDEHEIVYVANLYKRSRQMLIMGEIVKHYSVKEVDNIFLVHSPKWLKDIADSMYPGIIAHTDVHYTNSIETLETLKTLWDGASHAGILGVIGQSAELL